MSENTSKNRFIISSVSKVFFGGNRPVRSWLGETFLSQRSKDDDDPAAFYLSKVSL